MLCAIWYALFRLTGLFVQMNNRFTSPNMPKTIHEEVHEIRKILEDKFVVEVSTS